MRIDKLKVATVFSGIGAFEQALERLDITRAYQAKLPAWSEPTYTRTYGNTTSSQPVNNTPNMPNEYVHATPLQHQMKFDAFSF